MKYTIHGFDQEKLIEYNLNNDDAMILRWFVDFYLSNKMKKLVIDDTNYVWIYYKTILEDHPILGCDVYTAKKTTLKYWKEKIANIFGKFVKCGLMDKYIDKPDGNRIYFKMNGKKYEELIDKIRKPTLPTENKEGFPLKSRKVPTENKEGFPLKSRNIDTNAIDTNTIDTKKKHTNTIQNPDKYLKNFFEDLPNDPVEFEIKKVLDRIKYEEEFEKLLYAYPDDRVADWLAYWKYKHQNLPSIFSTASQEIGSIPATEIPETMVEVFDEKFVDLIEN